MSEEEHIKNAAERYSRKNYGSGDKYDYSTRMQEAGFVRNNHQDFEEPLSSTSYINENGNAYVTSTPAVDKTQVWDANDVKTQTTKTKPAARRVVSDYSNPYDQAPKKHHPIRNFLLIVLGIALIATLVGIGSWALKDDAGWAAEYSGTWQLKTMGSSTHPITSFGSVLFASSTTDLSQNMKAGIVEDKAQIITFGSVKDYSFSFERDHFKLKDPASQEALLQGDLRFGFLIIDDGKGNLAIYERTSTTYEPASSENSKVNGQALISTVRDLAIHAGIDTTILDSIDAEKLSEQLEGVSPETIYEAVGAVNIDALLAGDAENVIEEGVISSNTSVEELTQSVQEVWNASAPRNE